MYHKLLTL